MFKNRKVKRYYWMSFTVILNTGGFAFGNQYFMDDSGDVYLDTLRVQHTIVSAINANDKNPVKAVQAIISYYRTATEKEFDAMVARDVTYMEKSMQNQGR